MQGWKEDFLWDLIHFENQKEQETVGREVGLCILILWLKDQVFLQRFG